MTRYSLFFALFLVFYFFCAQGTCRIGVLFVEMANNQSRVEIVMRIAGTELVVEANDPDLNRPLKARLDILNLT